MFDRKTGFSDQTLLLCIV